MSTTAPRSFGGSDQGTGPTSRAAPAPAPQRAAVLHDARVRHVRTAQQHYALEHHTDYWLVDLRRLPGVPRPCHEPQEGMK